MEENTEENIIELESKSIACEGTSLTLTNSNEEEPKVYFTINFLSWKVLPISALPYLMDIFSRQMILIGQHKIDYYTKKPRIGGIKLQLLCSVRIELAIGSLPYPGMIQIPGSVLDEIGNYLDSTFVSLVWT